ncbi:MAG: hypothetical protein JO196_08425, partial [Hyphomicrobiales bacterium]|nr:hypothetical protein [Hyphomicrobiales bacterium]
MNRFAYLHKARTSNALALRGLGSALMAALALAPTLVQAQNYKDVAPQPVPA